MNITFPGPISAIWGVSYQDQTSFGEIGPLKALVNAGLIQNIFGFCILQENGTFSLGGIDNELYVGDIGYSPIVTSSGYYGVQMLDFLVSGISLGFPSSVYNQGGPALVDTGTFSIVIPSAVYANLSQVLNKTCPESNLVGVCGLSYQQSLFNGVCFSMTFNQILAFPTFEIVLKGVSVKIGGQNYLVENVEKPGQYCYGIQDGGPQSLTILGDVLMKNYYTIFDSVNFQIGFAIANPKAC